MKKLIIILMALIAYSTHVFADKVSFTASAPDAVVVGEQFRLSYIVTTQKVKDFRAPSIKGFDVLMGPSRSQQSSTQIVNGNVTSTSSITFTYILMANNAGEYTIPGASIVADGDQMVSNSVKIKVLPQDQGGNSGQNNSSSGSIHSSSGTSVSNQDLFIMASASKTNVYEQEAFVLTYKIYTRESNLQLNNAKLPDFKGFHSQEIEMTTNARWTPEHYQGRNYYTTVYRQFVLFPQQSGKLYIDPAQFQMTIGKPVQSDDPFDAFFNGGSNVIEIKKNISTPKIAINVNPLPTGKPADFSGGVGEFNISSSINSKELKTNDAITIKLVISGTGNLKLISNPEIKFPDDFEVYDPKVDNQVRLTREGLTGNKVIEYLAIPRHAGTYKIPGVSFSYFDIRSKSYKTLKTEDYVVNVEKGAGNADQVIAIRWWTAANSMATFKPSWLANAPHQNYTFTAVSTLTDGLQGNQNYNTGRWLGFLKDMDLTIDLQKSTPVSSVSLTVNVSKGAAVMDATGLEVWCSEDGKEYRKLASASYPVLDKEDKDGIYPHTLSFSVVETRYVRIIARVTPKLPAWHMWPGNPAFLFVDEVCVK